MKKNILSMAVLLMASAAVFTACSSDDNITSEQPANPTGKYTMTVQASKGDDATTRALTLDETTSPHKLNATWNENEKVLVYQNGSQIGTLYSAASTTSETTLTGELNSAPNTGQDLTLYFHTNATPSYAGQDGTLAKIASTYDFCAPATIAVGNFTVSGNTVSTTSPVSFGANQQAIVKFTLIDKADGTTSLNASQLVINDGTNDYTINPTSATSEIYAAIPGFTGQTVTLTATVGDDTYTYEKTGVSFTNGQYYEITVKMTKQAAYPLLSAATAEDIGKVVCAAGHLHDAKTAVPAGCTAVGIVGKVTGTGHGLILALKDATSQEWNTINGWTSVTKYASTTLKVLPDDAARGANLTSFEKLGDTFVSDWAVAQKSDYDAIFQNLGSTQGDYDGTTCDGNANAYITTGVGGTAISGDYWSATEKSENTPWYFATYWDGGNVWDDYSVRPVLGF